MKLTKLCKHSLYYTTSWQCSQRHGFSNIQRYVETCKA